MEPRSPTLQANSLPAEPPGKPKNIGVGSLSLLQRIFPTQELNWGLLRCQHILYQLSYQGSPTCKLICTLIVFQFQQAIFFIEVQLIYKCCVNICCIAVIQLHTHTHTHIIFFNILFHCYISQNIEYSSLCYTVGPCCTCTLVFMKPIFSTEQWKP